MGIHLEKTVKIHWSRAWTEFLDVGFCRDVHLPDLDSAASRMSNDV